MHVARLGEFVIDLRTRRLRRRGEDVPIQEQPFRILELLLAAPDHTLTREQLTAALWPAGTFVDFDRSLNTAINKLRTALGDSAESPRFIETIGRQAYRLNVPKHPHHRAAAIAIGTAVVALMAAIVIGLVNRSRPPIRSIAVLPLENLSISPTDAFLADGITDELITRLAESKDLQVISRQSVMRFKSARAPLPEIAQQLGVDAIVEGTVARSGDRVRVNAQLIDARTDRHIWAAPYECEIHDFLALQNEIADEVAARVGAKLGARVSPEPANTDAYLLYLRGRFEWNKVPPNFGTAIELFDEAIRKEPRFARAYAGLADCYGTRRWWVTGQAPDDAARARSLALTALRLDPTLAEAYTQIASLADDEHDYATAEANFRRAIAVDPNYIIAHQWYALHLVRLRRFYDAIREAQKAVRLDPLSLHALGGLALTLDLAGRYDEALATGNRMKMLFPEQNWNPFEAARQLRAAGRLHEAVDEIVRGLRSAGAESFAKAVVAESRRGGPDAAIRLALQQPSPRLSRWTAARLCALSGDHERALALLEQSYAAGENAIVYANAAPEFASMRGETRFRALISKMKLD